MSNKWGIPKDIEDLVLERDKCCVYCGCDFGTERAKKKSWEHIINDINIRTLENIALCCVGCNASKGNKRLREWFYSENSKKRGVTYETIAEVVKVALNIKDLK
ncbi:HNH endonuclease [Acinetobacter guillouiae]|uniref:HNH endonuclease n=1 Tax=Acinetobacter guillouiae TaxID=106649 RepID=UPI003AF6E444